MSRIGRIDVVGAGAWGLSAAVALSEAGAGDVHVWEREQPGSGATGRAAGLVSTHLRQDVDIRLTLETRRRLLALRDWGVSQEVGGAEGVYHTTGNLTLAASKDEARLRELVARVRGAGGEASLVDATTLARREHPFVGLEDCVGVWSKDDGYVEAQDVAQLLRARLVHLGGRVAPESPVKLTIEHGRCVGVEGTSSKVRSDLVVLAAGAWSKSLLARSALPLPVKPYRTQVSQLLYPSAGMPIFHDTGLGFYARPDGENRILVGDGTEHVESRPDTFKTGVDQGFVEKVARTVSQRYRDGDAAQYRTGWAGLCVATPDRDPIIGPDPRLAGLFLMVGDNGFGVMRSIALGAVAADVALGRPNKDGKRFDPRRLSFQDDFEIREGFEL